jgi:seryl-tRNA synthetase
MHDIKWIREFPEKFDDNLKKRGKRPYAQEILKIDVAYRSLLAKIQELQEQRNNISATLRFEGTALVQTNPVVTIKKYLAEHKKDERELKEKLNLALSTLPNIQKDEVPVGKDETFNQTVRVVGTPTTFSFEPKEHFELGEGLDLMGFEEAAQISGSRFVVLKGALARLERALAQFMLDTHVNHFGYTEVSPPLLVTSESMFGTGQLPNLGEDSFQTKNHWLIPTAEVPLTNLVAQTIVEEDALPLRFVGHTPCFRSEAGAAGKDTRGMLRQHQFYKVELVSIVHPDHASDELERMTGAAEEILKQLKLPYRVQLLCTGDAGFCSEKTYDLEVWLPGQNQYREISSCSSCGAFQARRMNARFRPKDSEGQKQKPQFVHTLNGSGLAVGRTLIAVLENYQQKDGSIRIPDVLYPYMNGITEIKK